MPNRTKIDLTQSTITSKEIYMVTTKVVNDVYLYQCMHFAETCNLTRAHSMFKIFLCLKT
jgi:hypothetical protein